MEGKSAVYVLCISTIIWALSDVNLFLQKKYKKKNKKKTKNPRVIKVIKHMTFKLPAKDIKFSSP